MNWKRFITIISSVAILAGGVKLVVACAGDDPDIWDAPTYFFNSINNKPAFTPFYYTNISTFYTNAYAFDSALFGYHPADENIRTWKERSDKNIDDSDISNFLYSYSVKDVEHIYDHIRKDYTLTVPKNVAQNKFTRWLIHNNKHEQALYLVFAKQCEPYTKPKESYWDEKKNELAYVNRDSAAMQELVHEGIKRFSDTKDEDLKMRYAYQTIRMAFYSGENPQTLMLCNDMLPAGSKHYLYYRCMAMKAGVLFRTNKQNEAAYLYSLVFDSSDEQKTNAMLSFNRACKGNATNVIQYCKSDHERAVVYLMTGMFEGGNTYGSDGSATDSAAVAAATGLPKINKAIKAAYAYDPKVAGLDVMMTRSINSIEEEQLNEFNNANRKSNAGVNELNQFAQKVAEENKNGNKAFWLLASSYLYLLDGNMTGCKTMLDKAQASAMTDIEKKEHYIITTLYTIGKNRSLNAQAESELLPMLQQLETAAQNDKRYKVFFGNIMNNILRNIYLQQKDVNKALLCFSKHHVTWSGETGVSYYGTGLGSDMGNTLDAMTQEELHKLATYPQRSTNTPYEKWLSGNSVYTGNSMNDLEGTRLIATMNFGKAIELLKNIPQPELDNTLLPDMFVSHITEESKWNKSDSGMRYNKLTFALRMKELQDKLAKDPADGRSAYQYANGLYSMSAYGKGVLASCDYMSTSDYRKYYLCNARKKLPAAKAEIYAVQTPERYYMQAYNNSTDPEVKARCLFMAAKCWQKNCPVVNEEEYFFGDESAYYKNSMKNPYFKQLKSGFSRTIFYRKAKSTCSYLQDYADTHK
jgi:hypothetical protein